MQGTRRGGDGEAQLCFRCSGKLQRSAVQAGGGLVSGSRAKGGDGVGDGDEVNMDTDRVNMDTEGDAEGDDTARWARRRNGCGTTMRLGPLWKLPEQVLSLLSVCAGTTAGS